MLHVEDELLFKRGCFNLIVGSTGCGKTSLLMALLGQSLSFRPLRAVCYGLDLISGCIVMYRRDAFRSFGTEVLVQPSEGRRRGIRRSRVLGHERYHQGSSHTSSRNLFCAY